MMCGWQLEGRVSMSLAMVGRCRNQKLKGRFGCDASVGYF